MRSGCLSTASVARATQDRSPGVSSAAFRAQSPGLRFASLMDMDFAVRCPLVRRSRLIPVFCPSTRTFASRFLQTPPRDDSPCVWLTLHLHQVGWRTFTSKLLSIAQHTTKPLCGRVVHATIFQDRLHATDSLRHETMASPRTPSASTKLLHCNEIPQEQFSCQTLRVTHPPSTS